MNKKIKILKKKLKENTGASYVELLVSMFVLFAIIAVLISVLSVFSKQSDLKTFTNAVLRTAELTGNVGSEVNAEVSKQKAVLGIDPKVKFNRAGRVDLGDEIEIETELEVKIGTSSLGDLPIKLRYRAIGRGEVYWK